MESNNLLESPVWDSEDEMQSELDQEEWAGSLEHFDKLYYAVSDAVAPRVISSK